MDGTDDSGTAKAVRATKPKAKGSRKRKAKKYATRRQRAAKQSTTTTGTFDCTTNPKQQPPSGDFSAFVSQREHKVQTKKGQPNVIVDVTKEPWIMSNGYLYCNCCTNAISWNNRSKHMISAAYIKKRDDDVEVKNDLDQARPLAQQRIHREGLVGTTYGNDKLDSVTLWLNVACAGNWSTKSVEENRVSCLLVLLFTSPICPFETYFLENTPASFRTCLQHTHPWPS